LGALRGFPRPARAPFCENISPLHWRSLFFIVSLSFTLPYFGCSCFVVPPGAIPPKFWQDLSLFCFFDFGRALFFGKPKPLFGCSVPGTDCRGLSFTVALFHFLSDSRNPPPPFRSGVLIFFFCHLDPTSFFWRGAFPPRPSLAVAGPFLPNGGHFSTLTDALLGPSLPCRWPAVP